MKIIIFYFLHIWPHNQPQQQNEDYYQKKKIMGRVAKMDETIKKLKILQLKTGNRKRELQHHIRMNNPTAADYNRLERLKKLEKQTSEDLQDRYHTLPLLC